MQQMGLQARLMSQALRKMSGNASKAGCTLMFLNQIRYKVWYIDTLISWLFFLPFCSFIWYAIDRSLLRESWSHQWRDSFEILCISSPRDTTHWENKIGKIYEVNSLFASGFTWECLFSVQGQGRWRCWCEGSCQSAEEQGMSKKCQVFARNHVGHFIKQAWYPFSPSILARSLDPTNKLNLKLSLGRVLVNW